MVLVFFFLSLYLLSIVFILPFCGVLSILGGTLFGWTSFWLSMSCSLVGAFLVYNFFHSILFEKSKLLKSRAIGISNKIKLEAKLNILLPL